MDETKAKDLSRINQDLADELSTLESEHFEMRAKFREMQDTHDTAIS